MIAITLLVVSVAALAVAIERCLHFRRERDAVRADLIRLDNSVHHNLRAIRARVAYGFPEAVAACDALESTLQARCRVDLDLLERRLISHRRAHNALMLDAAGRGDLDPDRVAMPWAKHRIEEMQARLHIGKESES